MVCILATCHRCRTLERKSSPQTVTSKSIPLQIYHERIQTRNTESENDGPNHSAMHRCIQRGRHTNTAHLRPDGAKRGNILAVLVMSCAYHRKSLLAYAPECWTTSAEMKHESFAPQASHDVFKWYNDTKIVIRHNIQTKLQTGTYCV